MRQYSLPSAAALAAAIFSAALPAAPPQRVTLEYEMSRNGSVMVELKETLEQDGKSYRISSEGRGKGVYALSNRGSVTRTSQGAIGPGGLRPREFRDQRGNDVAIARFDWAGATLAQEHRGKNESQPMPANALDRLSFLWHFAFAPPKGKTVEATVADGRGAPSRLRYTVAGTETLQTPAGSIEALRLVKQRDAGDPRGTEIWLAVKQHYVPVRILVTEKDGTRIDQVVTRING